MSGKKTLNPDNGSRWANLSAKDVLGAGKSDTTANMGRFKIKVSNGESRGSNGSSQRMSGSRLDQLFSPLHPRK